MDDAIRSWRRACGLERLGARGVALVHYSLVSSKLDTAIRGRISRHDASSISSRRRSNAPGACDLVASSG
jgi:hypothetical protein